MSADKIPDGLTLYLEFTRDAYLPYHWHASLDWRATHVGAKAATKRSAAQRALRNLLAVIQGRP